MKIDKKIDQQQICQFADDSNKQDRSLCNVELCPKASISRNTMNLMYMKPKQFELLANNKYVKYQILGPAGTGKTIVILVKIIDLVNAETPYNIILFAPFPHSLRCERFLQSNHVDARMVKDFPLKSSKLAARENPVRPIVWIVDMDDFVNYNKTIKESKRVTKPMGDTNFLAHVFIDDAQSMTGDKDSIDRLREICNMTQSDIYVWCAIDPVQGSNFLEHRLNPLQLPVYELQEILRNSQPIVEVIKEKYSAKINDFNIKKEKFTAIHFGHTINGPPIDCYGLRKSHNNSEECPRPQTMLLGDMIVSITPPCILSATKKRYLKETMCQIFSEYHVPTAVLYNDGLDCTCLDSHASELSSSVLHELGKQTVNIKDYIKQGCLLQPGQVICDSFQNISSFEMPLIIHVYAGSSTASTCMPLFYPVWSRARSKLIIIDFEYNDVICQDCPNMRKIISEFASPSSTREFIVQHF